VPVSAHDRDVLRGEQVFERLELAIVLVARDGDERRPDALQIGDDLAATGRRVGISRPSSGGARCS
jgi:hypothetical protein